MATALQAAVPVSIYKNTGANAGFLSNPGGNTFYFENPLYASVSLFLQDKSQFGSPVSGGAGGIIVKPYEWIVLPISPDIDVGFDCNIGSAIGPVVGIGRVSYISGSFLPMPRSNAGAIWQDTPALTAVPEPRLARYAFYDSDGPNVARGSLFRQRPMAQSFMASQASQLGRGCLEFVPFDIFASFPGGVGAGANAVLSTDSYGAFTWGPASGRSVIVGAQLTIPTTPLTHMLGEVGIAVFYDEIKDIPNSKWFVDAVRQPASIPNLFGGGKASLVNLIQFVDFTLIQWQGSQVSDIYIPIDGARALAFYDAGTTAAAVALGESMVTLYYSEY